MASSVTKDQNFGYSVVGSPNSKSGRGMISTKSYAPGDVIGLFYDNAIVIPRTTHLGNTCAWCFACPGKRPTASLGSEESSATRKLLRCSGCHGCAFYCSVDCQRADWRFGRHNVECKVLYKLESSRPGYKKGDSPRSTTLVRAVIKVMLNPKLYRALEPLMSHTREILDAGGGYDVQASVAATAVLGKVDPTVLAPDHEDIHGATYQLALNLACKIKINGYSWVDEMCPEDDVGLVVHPEFAMINHSCYPNAEYFTFGRCTVLVASVPLRPEQVIHISYIDHKLPFDIRQKKLADGYYFQCSCHRCLKNHDIFAASLDFSGKLGPMRIALPPPHESALRSLSQGYGTIFGRGIPIEMQEACDQAGDGDPDAGRVQGVVRDLWGRIRPLLMDNMRFDLARFAVSPIPDLLELAILYMKLDSEATNRSYLRSMCCIASLIACVVRPICYPSPVARFNSTWQANLSRLLKEQLYNSSVGGSHHYPQPPRLEGRLSDAFAHMDIVTICQALAMAQLHHTPVFPPSAEQIRSKNVVPLPFVVEAHAELDDVTKLPGREQENVALLEWFSSREMAEVSSLAIRTHADVSDDFFKKMVVEPLMQLAQLAPEVLDAICGIEDNVPSS